MSPSLRITVNGETHETDGEATISSLLQSLDRRSQHVAVEVNRQLIPREQHEAHRLQAGDQVEVVTLVGGG